MYSHLSCLVQLNQTQVNFSLCCGSFGQVWIQQSHSGADQTTAPRPSWRGGLGPVLNKLWYGWMDEPMNGWAWHTYCFFFFLQFLVHLQKEQCESVPHQTNKKNNIVFGPDQSKWTSWLSWCEYTSQHLKWIKTFHQICPKTKMHSCLGTTLINFFDPLQMLTTVHP